jgi:hypothetical protein
MKNDSDKLPPSVAATLLMAISSSLLCGLGALVFVLYKWRDPIWTNGIRFGGLAIGVIMLLLGIWLMKVFIKKQSK